jgi:hypothetical protein
MARVTAGFRSVPEEEHLDPKIIKTAKIAPQA